jgi:hypothetical protein
MGIFCAPLRLHGSFRLVPMASILCRKPLTNAATAAPHFQLRVMAISPGIPAGQSTICTCSL